MPADDLVSLTDHFGELNGGADPVLMTRFLKRIRHEADRRGVHPAELLAAIEERKGVESRRSAG